MKPFAALLTTALVTVLAAVSVMVATEAGSTARRAPAAPSPPRVDLGRIWGAAFRGRADHHVTLSQADAEADAVPRGASIDRRANTIRFTASSATITIVANPPTGRDMAFRAAGLENPTIVVRRGTLVEVRFVNADSDSAHGWLLLDPIVRVGQTYHGPRAFPDAYAPILGDPNGQGQPVETIRFRASADGNYLYECPVPGHAAMGMRGSFLVTA